MMQNRNYSRELDKILADSQNRGKNLFLHSCCAPCSSYVLEYLRTFFRITVFYFNPNITEEGEYEKRAAEQKRLIETFNRQLLQETESVTEEREREKGRECKGTSGYEGERECEEIRKNEGKRKYEGKAFKIEIVEGDYQKERFFEAVKGFEHCQEGGERCAACFALRLEETARLARERKADYFTTTLTISPLKNAAKINEIGERFSGEYGVPFLPSDFKKKEGYKRSIELSREYGLYRQDYCGCVFSKR